MLGIKTAKQTINKLMQRSVSYTEDDTEVFAPVSFNVEDIIDVGSLVEAGGFVWLVDSINYSAFPFPINGEFVDTPVMWLYLVNPMGGATFNNDCSLQQPASDLALWDEVQPFAPMLTGEAFRQAVLQ